MAAAWVDTDDGDAPALVPEVAPELLPELHADAASTRTMPAANPGTAWRACPPRREPRGAAGCAFGWRAGWITSPP